MAQDAAFQSWTVQMEAVQVFLRAVVVKYGQITGKVSGEAAGAAAFERSLLLVGLKQLRSSPLGLLYVDEEPRKPPDPAVLIVGGR